jgi:hypothetical protein
MRKLPKYPVIYLINTWVWLQELGKNKKSPVPLATVPKKEWDAIADLNVDAVWCMGLMLDFVPNHVAPDHSWVTDHPEHFIHSDYGDLVREPGAFITAVSDVFACGRVRNNIVLPV